MLAGRADPPLLSFHVPHIRDHPLGRLNKTAPLTRKKEASEAGLAGLVTCQAWGEDVQLPALFHPAFPTCYCRVSVVLPTLLSRFPLVRFEPCRMLDQLFLGICFATEISCALFILPELLTRAQEWRSGTAGDAFLRIEYRHANELEQKS